MEMIAVLPRYNTMKYKLQSMSGTLLGTCWKLSATVQNGILPTIKCQLLLTNVRYHT